MNAEIPDKVVGFNVYTQGTPLGTTGKVDTPEFKMKTSTMSGAGIGGDVESPTPGQWEATEHEIPLTLLGKDLALLLQQGIENPEDHRRAYPEDHEAAGCGNGRKPDPSSTRDGTGRSAELGSDRGC